MWIIFPCRWIIVENIRKAPYIRKFSSLCISNDGTAANPASKRMPCRGAVVWLWKRGGTSTGKASSHLPRNLFARNIRKYANVFSENLRKYAIVGKEKALQRLPEYRSPCKAWHFYINGVMYTGRQIVLPSFCKSFVYTRYRWPTTWEYFSQNMSREV